MEIPEDKMTYSLLYVPVPYGSVLFRQCKTQSAEAGDTSTILLSQDNVQVHTVFITLSATDPDSGMYPDPI